MITYKEIIETAHEIINNEKIYKDGLTLVFKLSPSEHKKLDEHLFYKAHSESEEFIHKDDIEVDIDGLKFVFITNKID